MIVDHIGIVVKSIEEGISYWEKVFRYKQLTEIVVNTRQKVKVVFLTKENSLLIKLIEPTDETSPIYRIARKGGGLHHLAFRCKEINEEISRLKGLGLRVITNPEPGEAFENNQIAFLLGDQALNIELIDTDKKAQQIML
ncbi:MAG: VOC family protein [Ignavibacteriaceae bacterium]|jgi:methylmalonyl-CoA/ethylmalonyl-CoA epimerase|nr:VOC family protein [Ignavibacteriaceae bacterium]MCU0405869.1 VOC family protein [Ignavibacteriaceae bacterium]MCU0413669.1 VOC family protein [Ignavibacteriaceae bacterium]